MLSLFQNAAVTKKELKGAPNVNMIPQASADVKNLHKVQNVENATMATTDLELIHSQLVKVQPERAYIYHYGNGVLAMFTS